MRGNIVGALTLGFLTGLIAAVATLAAGHGFLLALLAYSGAGSLGLVGSALLGAYLVTAETQRGAEPAPAR